jgi:RNA polymerase sigma-70 factor (ECF subfamily)
MTSTWGSRVDALAGTLERQAVTNPPGGSDVSDELFVEAARQGDRAAFGRLYDRYARMVHGILLARVPHCEVDDLLHDTFLQALRQLHTLRDPARFGAWLAAIARNRANDYHRHAVEQVELPESLSGDELEGRAASNSYEEDAEVSFLLASIRELPETYRETLLLRLVEGMTGPEIAARTGLTPGSVRVNLHRGMQQLREKLAQGERTPHAGTL